jgi:uncharacterized membrane-anchored protein YhcB (DUF1043 family)
MGAYKELNMEINEMNSKYRRLQREMQNTISSLEQLQEDFGFPYNSEINLLKQLAQDLAADHQRSIAVLSSELGYEE